VVCSVFPCNRHMIEHYTSSYDYAIDCSLQFHIRVSVSSTSDDVTMSHSLVQILDSSLLVPLQLAIIVQRHVQPVNHKLFQAIIVPHGQSVECFTVEGKAGRSGVDAQYDDLCNRPIYLVVALDLSMRDLQARTGGGEG
jgi:hypothetical protein